MKPPPPLAGSRQPPAPRANTLPGGAPRPAPTFPETLRAARTAREPAELGEAVRATAGEVRKAPVALLVGLPDGTVAQAVRRDGRRRGRKRKRRRNGDVE